jgi:hypothetical protein
MQADLIHLGAKYSPCMRRDENVERAIERDREHERETACCIRNDRSGCVQASRTNCSVSPVFQIYTSCFIAWNWCGFKNLFCMLLIQYSIFYVVGALNSVLLVSFQLPLSFLILCVACLQISYKLYVPRVVRLLFFALQALYESAL